MKVFRSATTPIRLEATWQERWLGPDNGLIASWERGRQKRLEDPELASTAEAGQLMPLGWKGGVERALKSGQKFGSLFYLAMWQGLRGDDLVIDLDADLSLTCSMTSQTVVFTNDRAKYVEP